MTYGEFKQTCQDYYDEVYGELKQIYEDGEYHKPTLLDGEVFALRRVLGWMDKVEINKIYVDEETLTHLTNDIKNLQKQLENLAKED